MKGHRLGLGVAVLATFALATLFALSLPAGASSAPASIGAPHLVPPTTPYSIGPRVGSLACTYTVNVTALPAIVQVGQPILIVVTIQASAVSAAHCFGPAVFQYTGLPLGIPAQNAPSVVGVAQQVGEFDIQAEFSTPYGSAMGATLLSVTP